MRNSIILILWILLLVACEPKQEKAKSIELGDEGFKVTYLEPPYTMRSSDLLHLEFLVEHHYDSQLSLRVANDDFGSFALLELKKTPAGVISPTHIQTNVKLSLEPGLPGQHQLPSLMIIARDSSVNKGEIQVPKMSFEVTSVLPKATIDLQMNEMRLSGDPLSVPLIISLSLGAGFSLLILASYLFVKDSEHQISALIDGDLQKDLRKGVASSREFEHLLCRYLRLLHGIDLAPLHVMSSSNQLTDLDKELIADFEQARFSTVEQVTLDTLVVRLKGLLDEAQRGVA